MSSVHTFVLKFPSDGTELICILQYRSELADAVRAESHPRAGRLPPELSWAAFGFGEGYPPLPSAVVATRLIGERNLEASSLRARTLQRPRENARSNRRERRRQ